MADLSSLTSEQLEEAIRILSEEKKSGKPVKDKPDYLEGLLRQLGQSVTGNWLDEAVAVGKSATSDQPLGEAVAEEGAKINAWQDENPASAIATDIIGGVGGGVAAAKLGPKIIGAIPKIGKPIQKALEAMPLKAKVPLAGGISGAIAGAGGADPDERAEGAVVGGTAGAALSAGAGALLAVGGKTWDAAITALGLSNAKKEALERLLRDLKRDEISLDELKATLRQMGPEASIADAGKEATLSLADSVANAPGKSRTIAKEMLEARHEGQDVRVDRAIDSDLTKTAGKDYYAQIKDIKARRELESTPAYQQAYSFGEITDPAKMSPDQFGILQNVLSRPSVKLALSKAKRYAADEGNPLDIKYVYDQTGNLSQIRGLDTMHLDYVKRGLDEMIENASPSRARSLRALKNEMLSVVDDVNPAFKEARRKFGMPSGELDSLIAGRDFHKMQPGELREAFGDLTAVQRDYFRAGAAEALRSMMRDTRDSGNEIARFWNSRGMRDRLGVLFKDPEDFERFASKMATENRFNETRGVLGGPATARRIAKAEDVDTSAMNGIVKGVLQGQPSQGVRNGINNALLRAAGLPPSVRDEIGSLLFRQIPTPDSGVGATTLRQLGERQAEIERQARGVANRYIGTAGGLGLLSGDVFNSPD